MSRSERTATTDDEVRVQIHAERVIASGAVDQWLSGSYSFLNGSQPTDLIKLGRIDEVFDALATVEQGVWG